MQNTSWLQLGKKQQHSRKYSSKLLEWSYSSLLFHRSHMALHYNCTDFPKRQHAHKPLKLLSIRNNRMPRNPKWPWHIMWQMREQSGIRDSDFPCAPKRPGSFEQSDQKAQDSVWRRLIPPLILLAGAEMGRTHKKTVFSLRYSLRPLQFPVNLCLSRAALLSTHEKSFHILSVL